MRIRRGIVGWLGVGLAFQTVGLWAAPEVYTDRAQWFSLTVPDGWRVSAGAKGAADLLIAQPAAEPAVRVTLRVRPLPKLPELVTREALVAQARAILWAVRPAGPEGVVTEIVGWPMTGIVADAVASGGECTRVTILLDPPRHRAFVWTATAPQPAFVQRDAALDRLPAALVPLLPDH